MLQRGQLFSTFYSRNLRIFVLIFVLDKPFQPSLMFVGNLKGGSLGLAPALPANHRLGWKGLPGEKALVYYENL
jgi:hypothetical protein